jgi:hypothetical protein
MVVAPDAAAAYVEKRMESRSPHPIIFFPELWRNRR